MADRTWPDNFQPAVFEIGLRSNVIITTSTFTGGVQTSEIPGARWLMRLILPPNLTADEGAEIEGWCASVRAQANRVLIWHLKRPLPRGTMRNGSIVVAAQGATQVTITGDGTLKPGDMIGVNIGTGTPQVVEVTGYAGGVADFSPPLRRAGVPGSSLVLDRPKVRCIVTTPEIMVPYGASNVNPGLTLDLMEVFA